MGFRRSRYGSQNLNRPLDPSGNLYYVKLNTEVGTLYKIGFTKLSSASERFSYGGSSDYKLISDVLLYKYFPDAYDIEEELHDLLSSHAAFPKKEQNKGLPFYKNGQTELYYEDVLGLDASFSKEGADKARKLVKAKIRSDIWREIKDADIYSKITGLTAVVLMVPATLALYAIGTAMEVLEKFANYLLIKFDPEERDKHSKEVLRQKRLDNSMEKFFKDRESRKQALIKKVINAP